MKPTKARLEKLAAQPGMTYTRMARLLGADKEALKELCGKFEIKLGKQPSKKEKTEPQGTVPKELLEQVGCMTEDILQLKKELKARDEEIGYIGRSVKQISETLDKVKAMSDAGEPLENQLIALANSINEYEGHTSLLSKEDFQFFRAFQTICHASMSYTIEKIHTRIDKHSHATLNLDQGKEFYRKLKEEKVNLNNEAVTNEN